MNAQGVCGRLAWSRGLNLAFWLLAGVGFFGSSPAQAGPALPPAEDFTRPPALSQARVSPDGERLAVLVPGPDGYLQLAVIDLQPIGKPRIVAAFAQVDVDEVDWVNDHRLIYTAAQRRAVVQHNGGGVFAVNHDGSDTRQLVAWVASVSDVAGVPSRMLPFGWFFQSTLGDGSDEVLMRNQIMDNIGEPRGYLLSAVNTVTGLRRNLSAGLPEHVNRWLLDADGQVRAVTTTTKGRSQIWWRDKGNSPWKMLDEFDAFVGSSMVLWHLDPDGRIYVTARHKSDTQGLFTFDPNGRRFDEEPVAMLKGFDLRPRRVVDSHTHKLVGIRYEADSPHTLWLDDRLAALQRGIDKALPGRDNALLCTRCSDARFFVVDSRSGRQPGQFLLFDARKGSLEQIGFSRPWIDEATQGRRSFARFKARDGMEIPVYVTRPAQMEAGSRPPAVVLVHGGPWVKGGTTEWRAEPQFLASRGYLVIEPEFRGSDGYGWTLTQAGWKQWGQRMQDDLADAVRWAADQQLLDPDRVCVMGGSYGGYASLMAPIATPGVFKCAISLAGVTDIDLMYDVTWSDVPEEWKQYGMPQLIGDPEKDAQMLRKASPLKRAAEIKVPVLLAYGGLDRRVPMVHAKAFVSAARAAGVAVEDVIYPDEGHGFFRPDSHADYLRRVETFLGKNIGPRH